MDYKIGARYPAGVFFEISVDVDGSNYLVIYGWHINGGFCCIPNWNIACEMGDASDTVFNMEALQRCKISKNRAKAIAAAIRDTAAALERKTHG